MIILLVPCIITASYLNVITNANYGTVFMQVQYIWSLYLCDLLTIHHSTDRQ